MTVSGVSYRCLPFDLIPDWIPQVGMIDNELASMTTGAGVMLCVVGYKLGSGEVCVVHVCACVWCVCVHACVRT